MVGLRLPSSNASGICYMLVPHSCHAFRPLLHRTVRLYKTDKIAMVELR
jgi:hypothetical protein